MGINIGSTSISDLKLGSQQVNKVYKGSDLIWQKQAPVQVKALRFTSTGSQTLGINQSTIGTVKPSFEYSTDGQNWNSWDKTATLPFGNGTDLYIRGMNQVLSKSGTNYTNFVFSTNSPVYCYGNVMHLYDYTQDLDAFPSSSEGRGLKYLFADCSALVRPPSLPATVVTQYAYYYMFVNCTSLAFLPKFYSIYTGAQCYGHTFEGCTNIKMSETQDSEYINEYIMPNTTNTQYMFDNTGGTYTNSATYVPQVLYTANEIID